MTELKAAAIQKRITVPGHGDAVLIGNADKLDPTRNILLLDDKDKVIWQIEAAVKSHDVVGFSNLHLGKNNELMAYSSNGIEYTIEATTGKILNKELIR